MRVFVTGTDTGVGKTRVTAAIARACAATERAAGRTASVAIVKLAQTGVSGDEPGDAAEAAALAGVTARELHRFALPADPWSAALAEDRPPLRAATLAAEVRALAEPILILEGSGGVAVPLNADETLADVAARVEAHAVLVVGLRLGCINHAVLTLEYLERRGIAVAAIAYTEPWNAVTAAYRREVERAVTAKSAANDRPPIAIHLPFEPDAARSVGAAARLVTFVA